MKIYFQTKEKPSLLPAQHNQNWRRQDDDDRAADTTKMYQATPTAAPVTAAVPDADSNEE